MSLWVQRVRLRTGLDLAKPDPCGCRYPHYRSWLRHERIWTFFSFFGGGRQRCLDTIIRLCFFMLMIFFSLFFFCIGYRVYCLSFRWQPRRGSCSSSEIVHTGCSVCFNIPLMLLLLFVQPVRRRPLRYHNPFVTTATCTKGYMYSISYLSPLLLGSFSYITGGGYEDL